MPQRLDPKFDVLPAAQQQIWNALAAAPRLGFVLYGGTAIALHLGHRRSIDFDFFRSEPLDKNQLRAKFEFVKGAAVLQDTPDTQVILAEMPAGPVKISFFGNIGFGSSGGSAITASWISARDSQRAIERIFRPVTPQAGSRFSIHEPWLHVLSHSLQLVLNMVLIGPPRAQIFINLCLSSGKSNASLS